MKQTFPSWKIAKYKELTFAYGLLLFSGDKLSRICKCIQRKVMFGSKFFKLKACLTFDDLTFADITPFMVGLEGREIEN